MASFAAKAAGIAEATPHANGNGGAVEDLEIGHKTLKPSTSRASLPLNQLQLQPAPAPPTTGTGPSDGHPEGDEDFTWGPSHPCYPHLNPHVPVSSPLYATTRIIRIKRDWMVAGDLAPTFANLYPEVLDPLLPEDEFRRLIRKINAELQAAFSTSSARSVLDAVMGVATLWLWDDVGFTGVKSRLRGLERWIEGWNREVGFHEGVKIIDLRRTGYMTLDIQIPDPHIGMDALSRPATRTAGDINAIAAGADSGSYPVHRPEQAAIDSHMQTHLPPGLTA